MFLQEAAIPFFRLDKLGVYNGAVNLYAQKQIDNATRIVDFYSKVIVSNQVEIGGHIGNTSILDERKGQLQVSEARKMFDKKQSDFTKLISQNNQTLNTQNSNSESKSIYKNGNTLTFNNESNLSNNEETTMIFKEGYSDNSTIKNIKN